MLPHSDRHVDPPTVLGAPQIDLALAVIDLGNTELGCRDSDVEALMMADALGHLELVLDATNSSIDEWNPVTDEYRRSRRWYSALGYDPDDQATSDPSTLIHPDDQRDVDRLRRQLLDRHTDLVEHVLRYRHADGTWRWHQMRGTVTGWDLQGRPTRLIIVTTDVTEVHRLQEQLTHSATMEALASFSCGIAHDFNNAMAIVKGHTEALLRRDFDTTEQARRLGVILHSVNGASALVEDLVRLARPDATQDAVMDVSESVADIAGSLSCIMGEDIEVTLDLAASTPIRIDRARFEALVLNLASNSSDAMPTGGQFGIRVARELSEIGEPVVVLDVTDTGAGMSVETLDAAFRPFFSAKPVGAGTGLGLATTYDTVHHAGGTISVQSTIGTGTAFHIRIPASSGAAPSSACGGDVIAVPASDAVMIDHDEARDAR